MNYCKITNNRLYYFNGGFHIFILSLPGHFDKGKNLIIIFISFGKGLSIFLTQIIIVSF